MSKETVAQVIHSSAQNHALARKGHDLSYAFPIIPAVAVDAAFLAGRLGVERTVPPFYQSMFHDGSAVAAENHVTVDDYSQRKLLPGLIVMLRSAIEPDETDKDLQVFFLGACKMIHNGIVAEMAKKRHDTSQEKSFLPEPLAKRREEAEAGMQGASERGSEA